MSEPLDIDMIRARANAAVQGPWSTDHNDTYVSTPKIDGDWDWICGEIKTDRNEVEDEEMRGNKIRENCIFVANARQDIPALCDEVEILKKKLEIAVKCLTEIYSANCVRSDEVGYIAGLIGATLEKIELLDIEPEAKPKCVAHEWWQPANVTARHQWLCIHCKTDYDIVKIGATT